MATIISTKPLSRRGATFRQVLIFIAAFAIAASVSMYAQHRQLQRISRERPFQGGYVLPKAEFARILAFGYDMVLADFYYLRAIQSFGGKWRLVVKDYDTIVDFFDTLSEFDPQFIEVYDYGSMVLSEDGERPEAAIQLNKKGWLKNLYNYRPSYLNAYILWWQLRDATRAKLWAHLSSQVPGAPEFVGRMVQHIDKENGFYSAALERWIGDYLKAVREQDDYLISISSNQFLDITDKWNKAILSQAVAQYKQDQEKYPANLQELVDEGYLDDYQAVDYFALLDKLESIRMIGVVSENAQRDIVKEFVGQRSGVPPSPYGRDPRQNFYVLRQDVQSEELKDGLLNSGSIIYSIKEAGERTSSYLSYLRSQIRKFQQEKGRYPKDLNEALGGEIQFFDPVKGYWDYDPETGEVKSPTFPNL
ncbi:MAG: hypothetical protein ACLFQ6_10340 [Candidatus Sumerlaeia bacterium]